MKMKRTEDMGEWLHLQMIHPTIRVGVVCVNMFVLQYRAAELLKVLCCITGRREQTPYWRHAGVHNFKQNTLLLLRE